MKMLIILFFGYFYEIVLKYLFIV